MIAIFLFIIINHGGQNPVEHFQNAGRKNHPPRILCPVKIVFRNEGEITTFLDKRKTKIILKECKIKVYRPGLKEL